MGIFKRIFGKPEKKEVAAPLRMSLEDVHAWIDENLKQSGRDISSEMLPKAEEILELKEGARGIVEEIRDYKPPSEIKKRMFKPVITAKPKYVKGMLDGLSTIRPTKNESYDSIVDFNARTKRALKIIHKAQLNQGQILASFFQEGLPKLGTVLNRIIDLQKNIDEAILENEEAIDKASSTKEMTSNIKHAIDSQKRLKDEEKKAKLKLRETREAQEKYEREKKSICEGADYQRLKRTETKLTNVQEKLAAFESSGRNLLSPLLRVLRKYSRVVKDKTTKNVTESFVKSPERAFFEDADGAAKLSKILNEVCNMAERGEIALDKKELEKVESAMSNLGSIKKEHDSLKKEENQLKDELDSSCAKKEEALATVQIKQAEEDIERLNSEIKNTKDRSKEIKKEIKMAKATLEEDISSERGREITVEIE